RNIRFGSAAQEDLRLLMSVGHLEKQFQESTTFSLVDFINAVNHDEIGSSVETALQVFDVRLTQHIL
ncbi:MAG: hypothetical protein Q9187_003497, partial [Circinaria calcarea]